MACAELKVYKVLRERGLKDAQEQVCLHSHLAWQNFLTSLNVESQCVGISSIQKTHLGPLAPISSQKSKCSGGTGLNVLITLIGLTFWLPVFILV